MQSLMGKTVLVTGGTGSIGQQVVRCILSHAPKALRIYSRHEFAQYEMRQALDRPNLRYFIGDVRDRDRLHKACEGVDIIFHVAALKHVDICEYNPFEAVKTNVIGTQNLIDCALANEVEVMVAVSTDKAVSPSNTMGATKLLAEKVVLAANHYKGDHRTRFCVARFGNILASRGSALPLFRRQIMHGGPVTLTHLDMRRFFITIEAASDFVIHAALNAQGGEIFIPRLPVVRIADLIQSMIEQQAALDGFNPRVIEVQEIGLKPGEKVYEALMTAEESRYAIERPDYWIIRPFDAPQRRDPLDASLYDAAAMPLSDPTQFLPKVALCT